MKVTFTAGQRVQYTGVGDFFRLLGTTAPVTVEFYYQGREIAERVDVEAGFAEQFRTVQFDRVDITSATVQTVQWETALGSEIRYDRGAATISGAVDLNAATLAALESIDLNIATINLLNRPHAPTGGLSNAAAMLAGQVFTLFTGAANPNGTILLTAAFLSVNAGTVPFNSLLTKATTPASGTDGNVLVQTTFTGTAGATHGCGSLSTPVFIPAGQGLFYWNQTAETQGMKSATWKTL